MVGNIGREGIDRFNPGSVVLGNKPQSDPAADDAGKNQIKQGADPQIMKLTFTNGVA